MFDKESLGQLQEGLRGVIREEVSIVVQDELRAVREDIAAAHGELQGEIASVREDLRGEIAAVRGDVSLLRGEIAAVRDSLRGEIVAVHKDLHGEIVAMGKDLREELAGSIAASEKRVIEAVGAMIDDNILPQFDEIRQDIARIKTGRWQLA